MNNPFEPLNPEAPTLEAKANPLAVLLRGDVDSLCSWIEHWNPRRFLFCLSVIISGAATYGAAMGMWRAPLQALFVAIKFPLIILLTASGNSLLNGMLAPLLGVNLGFRQSFLAILMSFTIASAILGAFSPILAFVIWNSPPLSADMWRSRGTYNFILLLQVVIIAFAGMTANLRLVQLLRRLSGSRATTTTNRDNFFAERMAHRTARRVLFAWLAGNFFLGSQLIWILRPFIGSPGLAVEFLRKDAFHGNFYETVWRSLIYLLNKT